MKSLREDVVDVDEEMDLILSLFICDCCARARLEGM
jgi:hypothetical protein